MHNALIQQDTTGQIIGAFFDVYFALGFGFLEHVYSLALERELMERRNQSDLRASSDGETPDTQLPPVDEPRSRVDPPLRARAEVLSTGSFEQVGWTALFPAFREIPRPKTRGIPTTRECPRIPLSL